MSDPLTRLSAIAARDAGMDARIRTLEAALRQAREALDKAHECATYDSFAGDCKGCPIRDTLAAIDAALEE